MMHRFLFLAVCLIISCRQAGPKKDQADLISTNIAVASGKPEATEAGLLMMRKGGNAADAAVATAFALSVVEPSMSGIGGRMQAIIRRSDGQIVGLDATTQVPAAYDTNVVSKEIYGYHVIGVPGVVAGLCKLLEEHGSLDLPTVMQPAITLADGGFQLSEIESGMHAAVLSQLREFEGTRIHFLKDDGHHYTAGETLRQPDLANTLRLIAKHGRDVFYRGEIAKKIV